MELVFVFPNIIESIDSLLFQSYNSNYLNSRSTYVSSVFKYRISYPFASTGRGFGCRMLVKNFPLCLLVCSSYYFLSFANYLNSASKPNSSCPIPGFTSLTPR